MQSYKWWTVCFRRNLPFCYRIIPSPWPLLTSFGPRYIPPLLTRVSRVLVPLVHAVRIGGRMTTRWTARVKWEKEWSEVTTCHASRTVIITALSAPTLRSLFVPFAGRYGERMMTGNAGVNRVPVSRSFGSLRSMPIPPHSIRLPKGMVFMMINL